MADEEQAPEENTTQNEPKSSKGPLLLVLGNTVAIILALGALIYTKVLFERPKITESKERLKIEQLAKQPQEPSVMLYFDPIVINIARPPKRSSQEKAKAHYAKIGFALEIKSEDDEENIEEIRPLLMDHFIETVGKKSFKEMNNAHGRYLLRAEIQEKTNKLLRGPTVKNVFFTHFLVQ